MYFHELTCNYRIESPHAVSDRVNCSATNKSAFGPSWKLERRVVMSQKCITTGKNLKTCSSVPTVEHLTPAEIATQIYDHWLEEA